VVAGVLGVVAIGTVVTLVALRGGSAESAPTDSPVGTPAGSGVPPIIVGGGSAIDHGVHLGSNVTTGPNVIIGSTPSKRRPGIVDYNPTKFDPLAYLPKAKALARTIYADAELTELEFYENVQPDGWVDLTLKSESTSYYEFRSPSHSVFPKTRNATNDDIPCYVRIDITATGISAHIREDDECDHPLRAAPRCTFAEVWKLSRTKGTIPATIGYLSDGKWFFDHDHAAKHVETAVTTSVEDCR